MPVGRLPLALATAAFCLSFLVLCLVNPWTYDESYWLRDDIPDASSLRSEAAQNASNKDDFSWDSISPSEDLIWHSCYLNKHCAKLKVPLDYKNSDASLASASIAMVRIHSNVSHESPSYRGPILLNPGGPGGSGVDLILRRGAQLSTIVGPEFDLIGFDPRGVGRSIPRVSYYKSRAERALRMAVDSRFVSLNHSADSLARGWARGILDGQLAGERDDGNLRFINTDYTARDMLRIVEAHGLEKLQYWGFSYGTVLGATFAAMFPDKVGRLVIDGVVDSENYYATDWSNGLIDTENAWMSFVNGCVAAGPHGCPFFAPTAAEILAKVDDLYASLRARPIPVKTELSSGLVDFSTLRSKIFLALYSPYATFPTLAQALADLSNGNGTALFTMRAEPSFECACDSLEYQFEEIIDAGSAIMCNDGKKISSKYEDLLAHYEKMSGDFEWADMWEPIRFTCLAWPDFPKDHFQGPFVANTSFPLLMVGNTADPVTPLWAAKKMSQGFAGSVVLTQDSPGHCSLAAPSICTQKHIRRYFLDGILPDPGTVCDVDGSIFPVPGPDNLEQQAQAILSVSAEDRNLMGAVWELAKTFDIRFPGYL